MAQSYGLRDLAVRERGWLDVLSPANPAAGANYSFTVGGLNVDFLRVVAATVTVATDANIANRLLSLDYVGGRSGTAIRNAATTLITASTGATVFQWDHAHNVSEWNTGTPVFVPLVDVLLEPGWSVQLTLDNKQVGDTLTAIQFTVERFYAVPHPADTDL